MTIRFQLAKDVPAKATVVIVPACSDTLGDGGDGGNGGDGDNGGGDHGGPGRTNGEGRGRIRHLHGGVAQR